MADELPDDFIAEIRQAMESEKPDSFLLGEVWEDGSNKIAYSHRRRYLLGRETHGLMNYPFRTAALAWLRGGDASAFRRDMEEIRENYPPAAFYSGLNILGTHDTPRLLTMLGAARTPESKDDRAAYRLSPEELDMGLARLRLGALLLYSFPGSPTVFYGDEAGMQGWGDPPNRGPHPGGGEGAGGGGRSPQLGALRGEKNPFPTGGGVLLSLPGGGGGGAAAAVRGRGDGGGHERRGAAAGAVHPVGGCAGQGCLDWTALLRPEWDAAADPPPVGGVLLV